MNRTSMLYMRTIPDKIRTGEVYPAAFDSIPHHCQNSELPTGGEHISASIESARFYGLGTSRFIERPERGLFAHGPVSGR